MTQRRGVLTKRELDVIGAWWHFGTVVEAADFLGISESTAKNTLRTARLRAGVPNTLLLARSFSGELPPLAVLRRHRKAA